VFLSRNLDQNMPKTGYFFRKTCKIAEPLGAPTPTPLASSGWGFAPDYAPGNMTSLTVTSLSPNIFLAAPLLLLPTIP